MKKNNMMLSALALAAFILAPSGNVVAEQITIPVGSQTDRASISTPQIGMSQASVRAKWGAPVEIQGPVGEPPISQWYYQDFIVYFEKDRVLHTVLKPKR
ncbi:hypothetical protein [Marinobacter sediminum]|uniref:hypothetical protein n=1 Tax=Marinobacter sediminum TaxID=256323 RepID=UPI00193943C1|nr:hypothetical protein [Marinobacter sediminum]